MKMKLVLAALLIVLLNTGSSCINDNILVPVNLPLSKTWAIDSGPSNLNKDTIITISSQLDGSYTGKIKKVRVYDIRVSVTGNFTADVSGDAYVGGTHVLTFSGKWDDFKTPQSLLDPNSHAQLVPGSYPALENALSSIVFDPNSKIHISTTGKTNPTTVPGNLFLTVEVLAQADAQVNGGDSNP